jgi:tetratricopeptide (TPR) repeat protein
MPDQTEGLRWVERLSSDGEERTEEERELESTQAERLMELGRVEFFGDKYEEAIRWFQEALGIYRQIGDRLGEGKAVNLVGTVRQTLGQIDSAIECFVHALAIYRELGATRQEGSVLGDLGLSALNQGRYEPALEFFEQALEIQLEFGDTYGTCFNLGNLGLVYHRTGQYERAITLFTQAIDRAREVGNPRSIGVFMGNLGNSLLALDQIDEAEAELRQSIAICDPSIPAAAGSFRGSLSLLLAQRGLLEEAWLLVATGEEQVESIPAEHAKFLCKKGRVCHIAGDAEGARAVLKQAQGLAAELNITDDSEVSEALTALVAVLAEGTTPVP